MGVGECFTGRAGCSAPAALAASLLVTLAVFGGSLAAHVLLPAVEVDGYAADAATGRPLRYRLNGPLCLLLTAGAWLVLEGALGFDGAFSARWFGWSVLWCNALGLAAALAAAVGAGWRADEGGRALTADQMGADGEVLTEALKRNSGDAPKGGRAFYLGYAWNVRLWRGADAKMVLYLVGACALQWHVLSFCALAARGTASGDVPAAAATYGALMSWFLLEYMVGEVVHLWTYDIFAERVGFKLVWGCCAFYPCFYCVGMHALHRGDGTEMPPWAVALTAAVFFLGWALTRGANLQKWTFKVHGAETFLCGLVENRTVPGSGNKVLCSGWWGLSRHINYLGEIVQAVALALPACFVGAPWWAVLLAWLYPLYYVALFVPRQMDDDRLCEAKYGEQVWGEYVRRVPWRIVPGLW